MNYFKDWNFTWPGKLMKDYPRLFFGFFAYGFYRALKLAWFGLTSFGKYCCLPRKNLKIGTPEAGL